MKVLALGGPGAMGAVATRMAVGMAGVSEVVIADRDHAAAERLARELTGSGVPVSARRVDVTDEDGLRGALESADVVLNTVGPYFRFGLAVLRAAIETRTHYLDICDDWEPTLPMLELDEYARRAGVCAIVGMGASPGVSNLLAAMAARELDRVDDVYTAWPVKGDDDKDDDLLVGQDGRPTAAAVHWMQQISGTVATVRAGQVVHEPPLRPVALSLPGGRAGTAYTVGHPEPLTLRRTLGVTGDSANLMIISPGVVAYLDVLRTDIDKGVLTNESAAVDLAGPSWRRGIRSMARSAKFKSPGNLPHFFAAAIGPKDGEPRTVLARLTDESAGMASLTSDMARATGIPLALGLSQVVDGTITRPGVHAPDAVVDLDRFFVDLADSVGDGPGIDAVVIEK
ncbi:lysine 6-dehydrogenase [Mycobacterium frederiksbergense]|uniref:Lysine 6-dehydrogenase n=1 Tax=Mycolicibacterium frederiksbergense TaxID=117567 RepID=A0ABT6L123_9MYCO|nr:saccharopine dehydrogenase NADP-binding domain-containing protein [Mycolicibacterium frederiksbergense]MDH6196648.1 lysine 6-dehydrogenase [Mycolicibacterium frederiksbergense]